jgi:hypothetical protein
MISSAKWSRFPSFRATFLFDSILGTPPDFNLGGH